MARSKIWTGFTELGCNAIDGLDGLHLVELNDHVASARDRFFQFQGRSSCMRKTGMSGNLARTSTSQACGSMSFILAVYAHWRTMPNRRSYTSVFQVLEVTGSAKRRVSPLQLRRRRTPVNASDYLKRSALYRKLVHVPHHEFARIYAARMANEGLGQRSVWRSLSLFRELMDWHTNNGLRP